MSAPFEQVYHHHAGIAGYGGSSYIDSVICRDRLDHGTEPATVTRDYVLQNWRADVIALAAPDGDLLERVSYDPYGIPFATHPTDLTLGATSGVAGYGAPSGTLNNDDEFYYLALYAVPDWRADWNRDGSVNTSDYTAYTADKAAASGSWGRGVLSNRSNILGYAGYVHEPATGSAGGGHGTMWHVRHRVLHAGLGRWVQRDPLEYIDSSSLYAFGDDAPSHLRDSHGLCVDKAQWTGAHTRFAARTGTTDGDEPTMCEQYQAFCRSRYMFPPTTPPLPPYIGIPHDILGGKPSYCKNWEIRRVHDKYGPLTTITMLLCAANARAAGAECAASQYPGEYPPGYQDTDAVNNRRHCYYACCLSTSLGEDVAKDILHAHECCSFHVVPPTIAACDDWRRDWQANVVGLNCALSFQPPLPPPPWSQREPDPDPIGAHCRSCCPGCAVH